MVFYKASYYKLHPAKVSAFQPKLIVECSKMMEYKITTTTITTTQSLGSSLLVGFSYPPKPREVKIERK